MKEKLKNSPWLQRWFFTQSPLVITRPALRETAECVGLMLGGFLLSCARVAEAPVPFALALIAAAGGGLRGLACLLGAAAGFLTMQPFVQGMELTSAGVLIYISAYVFSSLWVRERPWFRCLTAGLMTAIVGGIFLMSRALSPSLLMEYGGMILTAGLMPLAYMSLRQRRRDLGSLLALGSLMLGAARVNLPLGMNLGTLGAVALGAAAARTTDLGAAAALGLVGGAALDLMPEPGSYALLLGGPAAAGGGVPREYPAARVGAYLLSFSGLGLLLGVMNRSLWISLGLGTGLSLLMPARVLAGVPRETAVLGAETVERRLRAGGRVLLRLYEASGVDPEARQPETAGAAVDKAAEKVCKSCPRYDQCWDLERRDTAALLGQMTPELTRREPLRREDLPRPFAERCIRTGELLDALDLERRRARSVALLRYRREEDRIIVSRVFLHLAGLLSRSAGALRSFHGEASPVYGVEMGVSARGRGGARLSGDRGASFFTPDGRFFAVLCDGVGTGAPAAEESLLAVDTLTELIQAGMDPGGAMEVLNGMYVLRDTGGFSTMDLLELSLLTGQAVLRKWGAAPSYVRLGTVVRALGDPAPPPGLSPSGEGVEELRQNLSPGDLMVLVSDGAAHPDTAALLREFTGRDLQALADRIIRRAAERGGEDDMTAVVIQLTETGDPN